MMLFLIIVFVFALDRISKNLVVSSLALGESWDILEGIFSFTYVQNRGAAFSILQGQRTFFLIITVLVVTIMLFAYFKNFQGMLVPTVAIGLICGGALGNFFDRLVYGYVVDFLDFYFFPVFNIADSAIVVGVFFLFVHMFFGEN